MRDKTARKQLRSVILAGLATVLLSMNAGCFQSPKVTDAQLDRGCVIMLPGIEGHAWQLKGMYEGLRDAGIQRAIEIIPWGSPPLSSLPNLMDIEKNRKRADAIACKIESYRSARPDAPLTFVGYSGGGGLAILALEALHKDIQVDQTILIAGAISNRYDVDRVLPHCRDGLVNIYSRLDPIVGAGTSVFGTIDRKKVISAGHSGFVDEDGELLKRDKLRQIAWSLEWVKLGHDGGHLGYMSRPWARKILAPLIKKVSG